MPTVSATHAKQNFAALLDAAQREPVTIRRHDREVAVLMSLGEYERGRKLKAEELIRLSNEMGHYAKSKGLTEDRLERLLADEE